MTTKTTTEREHILEDAAWAAHCWVVDNALSGEIKGMCPADISFYIQKAIMSAKERKYHNSELTEVQKAKI